MAKLFLSEYVNDVGNRTAQVFKYTNNTGFEVQGSENHEVIYTETFSDEHSADTAAEDWVLQAE